MTDLDAWVLGRQLIAHPLNGELEAVSGRFRPLVDHLGAVAPEGRQTALAGFLCGCPDAADIIAAVASIDPCGPPPEVPTGHDRSYATLADIERVISTQAWLWKGWLAGGVLNVLASEPGTGKTRFALDLARRLWSGLPWPDGQSNEMPVGTRTLWVQGDRNFAEMLQAARDFGLPPEAVTLGASPFEPTGGLDLDDPEALKALAVRIVDSGAALVIIDTVGMTTSRNLCRPEEAREFFAPIMELAGAAGVALLGLTHLSANKEALGRRIVEKARVVIKMTQPDPEGQTHRRRVWVDKSAVEKPPPLGITMGRGGNDYDSTPPSEPELTRKPGPAPAKLDACKAWLAECLTPNPSSVVDVRHDGETAGHPAATLYRAKEDLGVEEYTVSGRKWWKLPTASDAKPTAHSV